MTAADYYAAKRARRGLLTGFCNPSWRLDTPDGRASHERCTFVECVCECHATEAVPEGRPVTDQATEVLTAGDYRSPEWYERRRSTITASEIAAVLGLSTWQSPFDLWWAKRTGDDSSQGDTKDTQRGRRYEQLIIQDFTAEHPEFAVVHTGLCVNNERPWQACTPDGLVFEHSGMAEHPDGTFMHTMEGAPVAVVEAKSAARRDEWGEPGTDDIPVAYRCQVLWQMDTLGLNVAYVPVIFGFDYREYVVEYDEADVMLMRQAALDFLTAVREDRQPDVDSHTATTRRLKRLHPELVDDEVIVPATLVRQYQTARRLKKAAEDRMRLAENRVRALLGPAAAGVVDLGDGRTKTFSHTRSDIKERTQTVAAHTRDVINFPRKEI